MHTLSLSHTFSPYSLPVTRPHTHGDAVLHSHTVASGPTLFTHAATGPFTRPPGAPHRLLAAGGQLPPRGGPRPGAQHPRGPGRGLDLRPTGGLTKGAAALRWAAGAGRNGRWEMESRAGRGAEHPGTARRGAPRWFPLLLFTGSLTQPPGTPASSALSGRRRTASPPRPAQA